jgi:hypothetical protein
MMRQEDSGFSDKYSDSVYRFWGVLLRLIIYVTGISFPSSTYFKRSVKSTSPDTKQETQVEQGPKAANSLAKNKIIKGKKGVVMISYPLYSFKHREGSKKEGCEEEKDIKSVKRQEVKEKGKEVERFTLDQKEKSRGRRQQQRRQRRP